MSTHAATSDCCSTCCASWPGKRRPDVPLFQPLSRLRERPAVQAPLPPAGAGGAQRRARARLLTGIPKTKQGNVRRKSSRLKPLPRPFVALGARLVIHPRDYSRSEQDTYELQQLIRLTSAVSFLKNIQTITS